MPTVVVRPRALVDLAEIWAYIAEDSADQADTFTDLIDTKFQALARRPGIGRSRPELATDLRSAAVGNYVIFYLPFSKGVEVVRVLHGARDLGTVLRDDDQRHSPPQFGICLRFIQFPDNSLLIPHQLPRLSGVYTSR